MNNHFVQGLIYGTVFTASCTVVAIIADKIVNRQNREELNALLNK